jgi:sec-independent protein translocase protein TatA
MSHTQRVSRTHARIDAHGGDMPCLGLFGGFGHWEIAIIGGVVVLFFFARRVPEVMRSLGRGVTQFRKGLREDGEAPAAEPKRELPEPTGTPVDAQPSGSPDRVVEDRRGDSTS